jgi:hypothetical protein
MPPGGDEATADGRLFAGSRCSLLLLLLSSVAEAQRITSRAGRVQQVECRSLQASQAVHTLKDES